MYLRGAFCLPGTTSVWFTAVISFISHLNPARRVPWPVSVLIVIRTLVCQSLCIFLLCLQCLQNAAYEVDPQNVSI